MPIMCVVIVTVLPVQLRWIKAMKNEYHHFLSIHLNIVSISQQLTK